jgi:hypothetical protein
MTDIDPILSGIFKAPDREMTKEEADELKRRLKE